MIILNVEQLRNLVEVEFSDIIMESVVSNINELRLILIDGSFIDIWYSLKLKDRYSYHWERVAIDGKIYRHDNAPHNLWKTVATFPKHFHNGSEKYVVESYISDIPKDALREFLFFARKIMEQK
ncbi:MAG: hypothetical protein KAH84_09630 [Thiomargarita sp.]|nr:hypothetical protein [Thiomargarita sp.]